MSSVAVAQNQAVPASNPSYQASASSMNSGSLFVGDIAPDLTEAALYDFFQTCGSVASVRICRDVSTRRSLGYAYVNFHNVEDANTAFNNLNYKQINGKSCRIMWSQRDPAVRKSGVGNVFVKNLPKSVDNLFLHDTFSVYGTILSCRVAQKNGESLGYGYVHFQDQESADKAIAQGNNRDVGGSQVQVMNFKSSKDSSRDDKSSKFTNVYIKNIPTEFTEQDIDKLCSEFGKVSSIFLPPPEKRGFCFANFSTHDEAKACLDKLNGRELNSKVVECHIALKKEERKKQLARQFEGVATEKDNKSNVYVKHLPDDYTDEQLRALFAPFGNITSARIMTDSTRKKSLGFGFVNFSTPEEATKAIQSMHEHLVEKKPLYCSFAQKMLERRRFLEQKYFQNKGVYQNNMYSRPPYYNNANPMFFPQQYMRYPYPQQMMGGAPQYQLMPVNQQHRQPQQRMVAGQPRRQVLNQRGPQNVNVNVQVPQGPQGPKIMSGPVAGMGQNVMRQNPNMYQQGVNVNLQHKQQAIPSQQQQSVAFTGNVRNTNQAQANQPRGESTNAPSDSQNLVKLLASARDDPDRRKRLIGERLYPLIAAKQSANAPKITGMLLELEDSDLLNLLESEPALNEKIEEALSVLKAAEAQPQQ